MNISQDNFSRSLDKLLNDLSRVTNKDTVSFIDTILYDITKVQFNSNITFRNQSEDVFKIEKFDKELQTTFLARFSKSIDYICSHNDKINFIPSDKKAECREECVVKITDDWKLSPSNKIRISVTSYWLSCTNINKKTLIISEAWIPTKFNAFKKEVIEPYENAGHTVVFVTYDEEGYSLRYPKR